MGDSHCEPTHRPLASAREPRAEPHGPLARLVPCMRASCLYGGVHAHMHRPTFVGRCHHAINSRCELACRPLACAIFKSRATWASCPARALHARVLPLRQRACAHAPAHLCWAVPSCNSQCKLAYRPLASAILKAEPHGPLAPGSCLACARLASKAACMHICTFSAYAWSSLTSVSRIAGFQGEAAISSLGIIQDGGVHYDSDFSSLVLCSSRLSFLRVMPGKL